MQGELSRALATALRLPAIALTVAGRTDAGVHATGQVVHADLPVEPDGRLLRRLAGLLPPDVRVTRLRAVPAAFDARFGALWRRYEYRLCDAVGGADPLRRIDTVAWPRTLDAAAMDAAARRMPGLRDFAAFCKRREGATTTRTLLDFSVARSGDLILCAVRADSFCHSMVRSLVGALLAVGEGRRPVDWPAELLTRAERANEVLVAPAHGLTLVEVGYPPDDELAARADQTRARRG